MKCVIPLLVTFSLFILGNQTAIASFICKEPGGKRLIEIEGKEVSKPSGKTLIYIDGNDLLLGDIHAKPFLVVDDDDVRHSAAGVIIAHFDGSEMRRGFTIGNGSMNSEWFKLGSSEMRGSAAMSQ